MEPLKCLVEVKLALIYDCCLIVIKKCYRKNILKYQLNRWQEIFLATNKAGKKNCIYCIYPVFTKTETLLYI